MADKLTDMNWLDRGKPWPPKSETARLKLYDENRKLFKGDHAEVFTENWNRLKRDDQRSLELVLNWFKRLSTLWADLLFGEPPTITAGERESAEQAACKRIIKDNDLMNVGYKVALDTSAMGTGLFKIRYDGDKRRAYIEAQPPELWFPVFNPDNINEVLAHVLAWTTVVESRRGTLTAEVHYTDRIMTYRYEVINDRIGRLLESATGPNPAVVKHGLGEFLVIPAPNLQTSNDPFGIDDYSDIDSIICELEVRIAQISRILDKNAEPSLAGPESMLEFDPDTHEYKLQGGSKYFPIPLGANAAGAVPQYVTWGGELSAAFEQFNVLLDQLYTLSETSAAAFGNIKAGMAESGSALRRLMMAPLAKVNRMRMRFDPALCKAIGLCAALEVAQGMPGAVMLDNVHITWQDGLPDDEMEQANIMSTRKGAGLISTERAIQHLDGLEGEELEAELDRIAADQMQIAPPGPSMTNLGGIFEGLGLPQETNKPA
ncbi:MAG: phage portal protein [Clostridia bacterium]|nr:phage portal protein [Clostridia bacterium]